MNGGLGLWPSHFDTIFLHGRHRLGSDEQACKFYLGGQRHDKLDGLGKGEDWDVELWDSVIFREEYVYACAAEGFGLVEICNVRMITEHHVPGGIGDAVVWVCGDIVEHLVDGL